MRQLIMLIAFVLIGFTSKASQPDTGKFNTLDTLTNADSDTYTKIITGEKQCVTLTVNLTKISGTVAGSVKYYYSAGNNIWVLKQTDTLTDASNTYGYSFTPSIGNAYKVVVATTGTSSASYTANWLHR